MASSIVFGNPSLREGRTNRSRCLYTTSVLDTCPRKEAYPGPRRAPPAQQIRQRRRLVAVGLHDRRSPPAQDGCYSQGHSPVDGPAVFHDAVLHSGLLEVVSASRGGSAAPMEHN